jgi:hypothetical protein
MVAPVSTELGDPGTFTSAFNPEFHAEIVPSKDTKMKWAGLPGVMAKSVVLPLKTTPVGAPIADWAVWGIVTVYGTLVPTPL